MQEVDGVICEDSRRASILLKHYQINKPLLVLNDFNEAETVPKLLARLKQGEKLALISDAGTPLISDPGYKLVKQCLAEGIEMDSLPGPSAVTTALTLSGLPPDKFIFLGFPPDKTGHRRDYYERIRRFAQITPLTFILFVAPFKLIRTLKEMEDNLGDLELTLAKELTKIHQRVEAKPITAWLEQFKKQPPKGEFTLLFRL